MTRLSRPEMLMIYRQHMSADITFCHDTRLGTSTMYMWVVYL